MAADDFVSFCQIFAFFEEPYAACRGWYSQHFVADAIALPCFVWGFCGRPSTAAFSYSSPSQGVELNGGSAFLASHGPTSSRPGCYGFVSAVELSAERCGPQIGAAGIRSASCQSGKTSWHGEECCKGGRLGWAATRATWCGSLFASWTLPACFEESRSFWRSSSSWAWVGRSWGRAGACILPEACVGQASEC